MAFSPSLRQGGFDIYKGLLSSAEQQAMVAALRDVARSAPFVQPVTRWGKPMSVRMTSAGRFGWVSTPKGYVYAPRHPSGVPWPAIPQIILDVWSRLVPEARNPESCLVNYYGEGARMGLHQDRDEADFDQPVVSISLGDDGLFRIGGPERSDRTTSVWLSSGDVSVMGGAGRLNHHGVDRIRFGSSDLLPDNGRLNVTLRVVT